jgi:hypothetical protein
MGKNKYSSSEERYKGFLRKIADTKEIYILWQEGSGHIFSTISNEYLDEFKKPVPVFHFWSEIAYPNEWLKKLGNMVKDYELVNITIVEFKELILKLSEFRVTLGLEWDQHGNGKEVMPEAILYEVDRIIKAIKKSKR